MAMMRSARGPRRGRRPPDEAGEIRVAWRPCLRAQRTAIGATVEPVAPCIFNGSMMKANS